MELFVAHEPYLLTPFSSLHLCRSLNHAQRKQKHKTKDMVDVVSRKCEVEGCSKRPWFSYDGTRSIYCSEHKSPGMIGYRSPQKDANGGGEMHGVGNVGNRKRTYADISLHDVPDHHPQPTHSTAESGSASDLVSAGLDTVSLAGMHIGADELPEGGLELEGMGSEDHLGQARMGVSGLGSDGGLDAAGIGVEGLDPTGMSSTDHLTHGALEERGLDTPGLDTGDEHVHHHAGHHSHHHPHDDTEMVLQHVTHPDSMRPDEDYGAADLQC